MNCYNPGASSRRKCLVIHAGSCMDINESLLRGILATVARQTFTPAQILKIVAPTQDRRRQLLAYNLCDGVTPQAEIGKKARLDKGNLSRSIARWIEAGIIIRVGAERHPLHVYPISADNSE
jgi:hypothetical protein